MNSSFATVHSSSFLLSSPSSFTFFRPTNISAISFTSPSFSRIFSSGARSTSPPISSNLPIAPAFFIPIFSTTLPPALRGIGMPSTGSFSAHFSPLPASCCGRAAGKPNGASDSAMPVFVSPASGPSCSSFTSSPFLPSERGLTTTRKFSTVTQVPKIFFAYRPNTKKPTSL